MGKINHIITDVREKVSFVYYYNILFFFLSLLLLFFFSLYIPYGGKEIRREKKISLI